MNFFSVQPTYFALIIACIALFGHKGVQKHLNLKEEALIFSFLTHSQAIFVCYILVVTILSSCFNYSYNKEYWLHLVCVQIPVILVGFFFLYVYKNIKKRIFDKLPF